MEKFQSEGEGKFRRANRREYVLESDPRGPR